MGKNYEVLNELVPKTQELHRAIFDKGYEQCRRQVLDEIERQEKKFMDAGYNAYNVDIAIAFNAIRSVVSESEHKECLTKI